MVWDLKIRFGNKGFIEHFLWCCYFESKMLLPVRNTEAPNTGKMLITYLLVPLLVVRVHGLLAGRNQCNSHCFNWEFFGLCLIKWISTIYCNFLLQ